MKATILFISLSLLSIRTYAQEKSLMSPPAGVFISYDGAKFREVGVRYWFSDAIALFGNWSFVYSQVNSINQESNGSTLSLGGGAHFTIYEINKTRFYAIAGMNYFQLSSTENVAAQTGLRAYNTENTQFDFYTGIGAEYFVAQNLSTSAHYTFHYLHESYFGPDEPGTIANEKGDQLDFGQARLLLSFYF